MHGKTASADSFLSHMPSKQRNDKEVVKTNIPTSEVRRLPGTLNRDKVLQTTGGKDGSHSRPLLVKVKTSRFVGI